MQQHGLQQQGVVPLDLPVGLAAIRENALALHRAGDHALVDRRLFIFTLVGKAAVVDALVQSSALQNSVDLIRPGGAPLDQLLVAVPAFGDRVLPAVLGAFRMLGGAFIAPGLRLRGSQIYLLPSDFVRILLFPSIVGANGICAFWI